jgi:hypothetical protein
VGLIDEPRPPSGSEEYVDEAELPGGEEEDDEEDWYDDPDDETPLLSV